MSEGGGAGTGEAEACVDGGTFSFYEAVVRIAVGGLGSCYFPQDGEPVDYPVFPIQGAVVIDSEGRIIDAVGDAYGKDEGLDRLAGERWPCYADQTIRYACSFPG